MSVLIWNKIIQTGFQSKVLAFPLFGAYNAKVKKKNSEELGWSF